MKMLALKIKYLKNDFERTGQIHAYYTSFDAAGHDEANGVQYD